VKRIRRLPLESPSDCWSVGIDLYWCTRANTTVCSLAGSLFLYLSWLIKWLKKVDYICMKSKILTITIFWSKNEKVNLNDSKFFNTGRKRSSWSNVFLRRKLLETKISRNFSFFAKNEKTNNKQYYEQADLFESIFVHVLKNRFLPDNFHGISSLWSSTANRIYYHPGGW